MKTPYDIPTIDPLANEARRGRREQLLGENPVCLLCGVANIDCLTPTPRSILEAHHVVGRENDATLTVPLCRNCHAEVTEGYRDAGVSLKRPPTQLHRIVAVLRALGVLLTALGGLLSALAETLIGLIGAFDTEVPNWRMCEGVQP